MNRASEPDLPAICVQEAVNCHSCTAVTARELARACPGLPAKLVTQLFVQIHVHSACARMHSNFARAYTDAASTDGTPAIKKPVAGRPPLSTVAAA